MFPSQRLVSFVGEYQRRTPEILGEFNDLFRKDFPIHPIPFFGPLETARILTVGLNPSSTEFVPWRRWPNQLTPESLARRLFYYFKLSFPRPHSWFAELQQAVSIVNCSYEVNVAHTDLAPWATLAQRNLQGEQKYYYENLLKKEVRSLTELVRFSRCLKLVIILPWGSQRNIGITAIQDGFSGRVETIAKEKVAEWFWENREELNALIHS